MAALLALALLLKPPAPLAPVQLTEGPTRAQRLERLERELEQQRTSMNVAGLAIAIVQSGEVIYAGGFGLADIEGQRAVTPETIFAIGSSTKAFTATLVGTLVDEGRLDWDDPVTSVLPGFELAVRAPEPGATVTFRDLLAHRTGFARADLLWAGARASPELVLETIVKAEPWTDFRGEFLYNNIMFLAAGEAAAKLAGQPWDELLRERILEPLGMHSTTTSIAAAQADERLASGYLWDEERQEFERLPMRSIASVAPAGAINSNVLDMARWLRLQLGRGEFEGRRLIGAETLRETWTRQIDVGGGVGYGLGWMLRDRKGQPVVEHGGNIDGFSAQVGLLPESDLGFVLLANVSATPLQQGSLELVWKTLVDEAREERAAGADRAPLVGSYTANFASFQDVTFEVLEKDGKLAVDVPGQMVYALEEPDAEGRWYFELTDQIAVSFDLDEGGRAVGMKMHQAGLVFELPREGVEAPIEIDLEDARRLLGRYQHPAFEEPLSVLIRNNRLAVDVPGQMVCELHAPDAEGKRVFRVNDRVAVRFEGGPGERPESLTFFERGSQVDCPRVADGPTEELPSLDDLHALRGSSRRGAALAALGAWRMRGKVRLVHMGIEGQVEVRCAGPERFLVRTDLEPFATIEVGFDRGRAASAATVSPYRELTGRFRDAARMEHPAVSIGDWRQGFERIVVLRADEHEKRRSWVVRLDVGEETSLSAWIDAETGDTLREEFLVPLPGGLGSFPRSRSYSDYREFEGLRMPYRSVSEDELTGRAVFELESIEAHLDLGPDAFRVGGDPTEADRGAGQD